MSQDLRKRNYDHYLPPHQYSHSNNDLIYSNPLQNQLNYQPNSYTNYKQNISKIKIYNLAMYEENEMAAKRYQRIKNNSDSKRISPDYARKMNTPLKEKKLDNSQEINDIPSREFKEMIKSNKMPMEYLTYSSLDLKKFSKKDFEFGSKLGKGKFGDVYLAREKSTNIIVAIKVLDKATIRHLKAQKQIIREIKNHSYLNHKNIIQLYGVFHDDEKVYMILEYAPNGELYKELKSSVNIII